MLAFVLCTVLGILSTFVALIQWGLSETREDAVHMVKILICSIVVIIVCVIGCAIAKHFYVEQFDVSPWPVKTTENTTDRLPTKPDA